LNSLYKTPRKFDIDLENLIESLSDNGDANVQKVIGILKDNRGIGLLDFEEETTN
jgi:hypothetical protein